MFQVWDGNVFLFYCRGDETGLYDEQGFQVVEEN